MTSKATRYPELGNRISQVINLSGKSKGDFAEAIGVKPQNLSRWLSGEVAPQYEYMLKIGKLTERSMDWLCFGEKKAQTPSTVSASVPLYNVAASGGDGAFITEEAPIEVLAFKKEWLTSELGVNPDNLSLLFVSGESMEPTLRPGDMVMIVRQDGQTITDGIYIVRLEDALLVKRLQRLPGGVMEVSSDNPAYKPFNVKLSDESRDFAVIGRVVWTGRRF